MNLARRTKLPLSSSGQRPHRPKFKQNLKRFGVVKSTLARICSLNQQTFPFTTFAVAGDKLENWSFTLILDLNFWWIWENFSNYYLGSDGSTLVRGADVTSLGKETPLLHPTPPPFCLMMMMAMMFMMMTTVMMTIVRAMVVMWKENYGDDDREEKSWGIWWKFSSTRR